MTEKTFKYYEDVNGEFPFPYIKSNDDKNIISLFECCNLLNELHEEKEQLKKNCKNYNWYKQYKELLNENEQLKQSNNEAIELILDGVIEMHDGKRDYAEKLLNEAIELIK